MAQLLKRRRKGRKELEYEIAIRRLVMNVKRRKIDELKKVNMFPVKQLYNFAHICSYATVTGDDCISNNRQQQASVNFQISSYHRYVEISSTFRHNYKPKSIF